MTPLVSVCILTYNSAAFIADAIQSAISQTLQNIEIIIVDNGSKDSTLEICNHYKAKDPRISVFKNDIPLGISGGLNSCLERSKGEYVKILMHDDMLAPDCLEKMVAIFEQFPNVKLVGCSEQQIDEKGNHLKALQPSEKTGLMSGKEIAKTMLTKMTNIIGTPSTVLMRRCDYGSGFSRSLFLFEDAEVYIRALLQGDYYYADEPLSKVRVHEKTGSSINSNTLVFISDLLKLRDMYSDFMQSQGVNKEDWSKIIDERILAYTGHMLETEGITAESARLYAPKLQGLAGFDYTDQLLSSMAEVIYYGYSHLFKTNLEANFYKKENERLVQEINSMSQSLPFRIAQPLRNLKSKIFAGR